MVGENRAHLCYVIYYELLTRNFANSPTYCCDRAESCFVQNKWQSCSMWNLDGIKPGTATAPPIAHKNLWSAILYCTVFRFTATLDIAPRIAVNCIGFWMCVYVCVCVCELGVVCFVGQQIHSKCVMCFMGHDGEENLYYFPHSLEKFLLIIRCSSEWTG